MPDIIDPAIAILEISSIAKGIITLDVMIKQSHFSVIHAGYNMPGKYLIIINGKVADTEEAYLKGQEVANDFLIDTLFLPHPDENVCLALNKKFQKIHAGEINSVAIIECMTVASTIKSLDISLKCTSVIVTHLQLAQNIHGKGYFELVGKLEDLESSVEEIKKNIDADKLFQTEIIARPHRELLPYLASDKLL